jgi:ADP-ribosylglycohydrolase
MDRRRATAPLRQLADALTGCLLGQALGDALGFVVEARPPGVARDYVERYLLAGRAGELAHPDFPFGQYSDDTQLARELLISFVEAGGWSADGFARRVGLLFAHGRDVGAGPGTRAAARRLLAGTHWSRAGTPAPYAGNGSAMRAAPLGILFQGDLIAMTRAAVEQSMATHLDPRCAAGALAVASAVSSAGGDSVACEDFAGEIAEVVEPIDRSFAGAIRDLGRWGVLPPDEAARHLHAKRLDPGFADEWRGISAFVVPSVLWSLYAFLQSPDDYWTVVCTAIRVGGDTDTMAAIAGAVSGARLGTGALPRGLLERLTDRGEWGWAPLAELAERAARLAGR